MKLPVLGAAAFGLNLLAASAFAQAPEHARPASHTLEFIENKGQWEAPVRYVAPLPGGRLFAEANGLTLASAKRRPGPAWAQRQAGGPHRHRQLTGARPRAHAAF